jgi:ABC-type molybdate transport system substrate-binding protein
MMAEGACPLNLGYANLANLVSGIEVIAEISGDLHTPVVYLVAQVQGGENELVGDFGEYLVNSKSKAIFKSQGFLPPPNGAD